jgi:hypothetical protein
MTIDVALEHEIRRLHDVEKWKRGTIAAERGVHPDVVDRVLDRGADRVLVSAPKPSLVDPYGAFIAETLKAHPRLRATRLFDMIRMRGYTKRPASSFTTDVRLTRARAATSACLRPKSTRSARSCRPAWTSAGAAMVTKS